MAFENKIFFRNKELFSEISILIKNKNYSEDYFSQMKKRTMVFTETTRESQTENYRKIFQNFNLSITFILMNSQFFFAKFINFFNKVSNVRTKCLTSEVRGMSE